MASSPTTISDHPAPVVVGGNAKATSRSNFKRSTITRAAQRKGVSLPNVDLSAKKTSSNPIANAARQMNADVSNAGAKPTGGRGSSSLNPDRQAALRAAIGRRQETSGNSSAKKNFGTRGTSPTPSSGSNGLGDKIRLLAAARNSSSSKTVV